MSKLRFQIRWFMVATIPVAVLFGVIASPREPVPVFLFLLGIWTFAAFGLDDHLGRRTIHRDREQENLPVVWQQVEGMPQVCMRSGLHSQAGTGVEVAKSSWSIDLSWGGANRLRLMSETPCPCPHPRSEISLVS